MKCSSCDCTIIINPENNERNIGIEKDNKYYCIPCHEAIIFMCDIDNSKIIKKEKPVVKEKPIVKENKISSSHIYCYKCNKPYENNKCNNCNIFNPLSIRKSKKKRKNKKIIIMII